MLKKTLFAFIVCSLALHICVFNSFIIVEHEKIHPQVKGGLDTSDSHAHEDDLASEDKLISPVLVNPASLEWGLHLSSRALALSPLLPPPKNI
jgi:hypothetical protein